ncbi:MAG: ATP-binding cassette domain-containing protein [Gammaproteobacteria bacterium]|nr:ATP-binding cassette domain-containing protein [Gammaproteobacteria bacterium]NNC97384.1 ATP-binding cassette domain-containing protein [Gammaproteobacteria bacterium]NNM13580.1 ATP-binding cassette domain-containing protein [Gammaproteobacteria bacterium]
MTLIRFDEVSIAFGEQKILREASFLLEEGERVCLIGRNGAGKSTLLKLLTSEYHPDSGEIQFLQDLRISQLRQELPQALERSVNEVVREGLSQQVTWMQAYEEMASQELDENGLRELEQLQAKIDAVGGWKLDQIVDTIMTQLELPKDKKMSELSGGWRRRVMLGQALVSKPQVLLLDEPTNHLDISTIEWLEHRVRSYKGSVIFITHDRDFMQKLSTRILEIDRGKLVSWTGNYKKYLQLKEAAIIEEDRHNKLFDKKLAQEESWIRQGIKARRTRNEGRVRALQDLRETASQRIKRSGKVKIHIESGDTSGKKVITAHKISYAYGDEVLLKDFSIKVTRGDRIGLIGNNGVGKSTLLKILLGHLEPQGGTVKLGTNLKVAYFDQMRRELDESKTVAEYVGDGKDYIQLAGKQRHVVGYLKNFLFTPKRSMTLIRALSGGERNRVLLAKLLTRPANLLVLDEPTNDLDVEMLEVLEERLVNYDGTLIIVSHDRHFLDNVVTSVLVFEGDGKLQQYVGGYSDWARRGKELLIKDVQSENDVSQASAKSDSLKTAKPKKLSYKLQREYDMLPEQIDALEKKIASLNNTIAQADFYAQEFSLTEPVLHELAATQSELEKIMLRWMELEDLQSASSG